MAKCKSSTGCASATIQKPRCGGCIGHCHHLSFPQVLLRGRARKIYPRTFGLLPHVLGAGFFGYFFFVAGDKEKVTF